MHPLVVRIWPSVLSANPSDKVIGTYVIFYDIYIADIHCCVLTLLKDPPLQTMGAEATPSHGRHQDLPERETFPGKSRSVSSHLLTSTGPAPESNYEHIKGFPHETFVWQDLSFGPVMTVGLAGLTLYTFNFPYSILSSILALSLPPFLHFSWFVFQTRYVVSSLHDLLSFVFAPHT